MQNKKVMVKARVKRMDGTWREFTVRGQTARSLLALVNAGATGCTALEVSSWALRFAAYCHDLIHKHGLSIETKREEHPGGWHGRHILRSQVEILEVVGGEQTAT